MLTEWNNPGLSEVAMSFFVWSSAFSVGVEHLDKQHRIMFDLMNRMYDSVGVGTLPKKWTGRSLNSGIMLHPYR